jgi:DNA-binding XRE family transcriptional regulator
MKMIIQLIQQLEVARKAASLTQANLAQQAGLSRMTIQRTEAGHLDPRLSTMLEMARALGMELILVPGVLRAEVEDFLRSGGRFLAQPAGISAPLSIVDAILAEDRKEYGKP